MEEQDTQTTAPSAAASAPAEGHADGAAQSLPQGTAAPAETKAAETQPQSKYLGKKYSDLTAFEKAHGELLSERQPLAERANLADKVVERLAKETGQSKETVEEYLRNIDRVETEQAAQSTDPAIKQEIIQTRLEIAKMKEDKILDDLIADKPHLASVRSDLRASWIMNNVSLDQVVERYEKLVAAGRNERATDQAAKQHDQVATGKGTGEPDLSAQSSNQKFNKALETGRLEDFADALPDNLSLKR